jgi:hypothetical protein
MNYQVGEVVVFVCVRPREMIPAHCFYDPRNDWVGQDVTIIEIDGPNLCIERDGISALCEFWQVRKRRPPEERGSWVDVYSITGWMPLERNRA